MNIREAYAERLARDGHSADDAQQAIVERLADLQTRLQASREPSLWQRLLGRSEPPLRGLYLWGGVGRGKTFLMDLFFETLAIEAKRRIHFHRMLRDVHERLDALGDIEDPLDQVAADIAADTRVLCFDEFFVNDIGDAMILSRFLGGLFARNVVLVTTSNSEPDHLYHDGLQRQRFLPAIELLKTHTEVVELAGGTDYRLRLLQQAGTYLLNADPATPDRLQRLFDQSATSQIATNVALAVNNRDIVARQCAKGIAWFDFAELCDGPRSAGDYIEIGCWYPTVLISDVPQFDSDLEDQARRFVTLVDEFYDRRVKLIVSAAAPVGSLYSGKRLNFEFERTVSRLIEMQSTEYLGMAHLG